MTSQRLQTTRINRNGHPIQHSRDNYDWFFSDTFQGFITSHKKNYRKIVKEREAKPDKEPTVKITVPVSKAEEVFKIIGRKPGNRITSGAMGDQQGKS